VIDLEGVDVTKLTVSELFEKVFGAERKGLLIVNSADMDSSLILVSGAKLASRIRDLVVADSKEFAKEATARNAVVFDSSETNGPDGLH
jgi:hypothetical protein